MSRSLIALAVALLAPPAALAASVIMVQVGSGSIQDAIDTAAPGDVVELHPSPEGYPWFDEAIVIDKPLTLRGRRPAEGEGRMGVNAACAAPSAITVAADRVRIGDVAATNATLAQIDIVGRAHVALEGVTVIRALSLPPFPSCGAPYGVRVVGGRSHRLTQVYALSLGFLSDPGDAALSIADVGPRAHVGVRDLAVQDYGWAVVIENAAATGRVTVQRGTIFAMNPLPPGAGGGISLRNADGVKIKSIAVRDDNSTFPVTVGIALDATSDGNRILGNDINGAVAGVQDLGAGNCLLGNSLDGLPLPSYCP